MVVVVAGDGLEQLPVGLAQALDPRPRDAVVEVEFLNEVAGGGSLADAGGAELPAGLGRLTIGRGFEDIRQRLQLLLPPRERIREIGLSEVVPVGEHGRSVTRGGYLKQVAGVFRENWARGKVYTHRVPTNS